MIKHPSSTKTQVICDKCRVVVEFAAGLNEAEANIEIIRHGWDASVQPEGVQQICPPCHQGKWGAY